MKTFLKNSLIYASLSFSLILVACVGNGKVIEERKEVKDFTSVELAVPGNLFLTQGNEYSFLIKADEDLLKRIEVEVEGGRLKIRTPRGLNFSFRNEKVEVHITMPSIEGLAIAGSGNIEAVTPINAEGLKTSIAGSGNIKITNLIVASLSTSIAGSGDIILAGKGNATEVTINIAGSGDVLVHGIEFENASVSIAGSGNASVEAKENLKARVAGSGDILYKGNPLVDAKVSGSGKIKSQK